MDQIKTIFDTYCETTTIDLKLAKRVAAYQAQFRTKNEDHIAFFGGKLLGVQVVRFLPADRARWFEEILNGDDDLLTEKLSALSVVKNDAGENFKVSSDAFNLSCVWLLHRFFTSSLTEKDKTDAMVSTALVLQYKFLTSILYNFFKYPADKAVAEATYAQLSKRFAIKNYANWYELFKARAEELVSKSSIHRHVIEKMNDDKAVVNMVNDIQGRVKDLIKNIYREFMLVHQQGLRITSTSAVMEFNGEEVLRDKVHGLSNYTRYLHSVISDKSSFIRQDLVSVIEKMNATMNPRLFRQCLSWMSDNYQKDGQGLISTVIDECLIHSFNYLLDNASTVRNMRNLPDILVRLKGTYTSSRSSDPVLMALREHTETLVRRATLNKNANTVAALRTGVLLYLCLRTYAMQHVSQALVD